MQQGHAEGQNKQSNEQWVSVKVNNTGSQCENTLYAPFFQERNCATLPNSVHLQQTTKHYGKSWTIIVNFFWHVDMLVDVYETFKKYEHFLEFLFLF